MGMNIKRDENSPSHYQPMAEINVTPMVDVMLVLLIIFMITSPMLVAGVSVGRMSRFPLRWIQKAKSICRKRLLKEVNWLISLLPLLAKNVMCVFLCVVISVSIMVR